MKNLSATQSYLLCSLNEKGGIPAFSSEIPVCMVAGAVIDLTLHNCVEVIDKKVKITAQLTDELYYLRSIYDFIKERGGLKLDKLASEYCFSFSSKKVNLLIDDTGESLSRIHCVSGKQGGLLKNTKLYVPDPEVVDHIIQTIRAEVLEEGNLSDEVIALTSLLEQSGMIKKYFSSYEKKTLKLRLNEIKNSPSHKIVNELNEYITTMIAVIAVTGSAH